LVYRRQQFDRSLSQVLDLVGSGSNKRVGARVHLLFCLELPFRLLERKTHFFVLFEETTNLQEKLNKFISLNNHNNWICCWHSLYMCVCCVCVCWSGARANFRHHLFRFEFVLCVVASSASSGVVSAVKRRKKTERIDELRDRDLSISLR
jgi:hypothetical protein